MYKVENCFVFLGEKLNNFLGNKLFIKGGLERVLKFTERSTLWEK